MKSPIKVTITRAAGHIGYALAFRVGSGAMFGPNQLELDDLSTTRLKVSEKELLEKRAITQELL